MTNMKPETWNLKLARSAAIPISSNCSNRSNSTKKLTSNSTLKPNPARHLWQRTSPHKKFDNASQLLCKGLVPNLSIAPLCGGHPTPHFPQASSEAPIHSSALPTYSSHAPGRSSRPQLERTAISPILTPQQLTTKNRKLCFQLERSRLSHGLGGEDRRQRGFQE
jgi:hypothetical protein